MSLKGMAKEFEGLITAKAIARAPIRPMFVFFIFSTIGFFVFLAPHWREFVTKYSTKSLFWQESVILQSIDLLVLTNLLVSFGLDLTNTLTGDTKFLSYFFQCMSNTVEQSMAHLEDLALLF